MKPLSKKKEVDIIALLTKSSWTMMVAKSLGFFWNKVKRVRRKHCSSLDMLKHGCSNALIVFERREVVHLVTIGGLETAVKAVKVLRVCREVDFCDNTLWNALIDVDLRVCEIVPMPY